MKKFSEWRITLQAPEVQEHEIQLENEIKKTKVVKATPSHFELLKVLGQGSFGKVCYPFRSFRQVQFSLIRI